MDISLGVSAARSGPTLQTWITQKWRNILWAFSGYENMGCLEPFAIGFMHFSQIILEWELLEWTEGLLNEKLNYVKTGGIARESSVWNYTNTLLLMLRPSLGETFECLLWSPQKFCPVLNRKKGLPKMINKSVLLWKDSQMAHFLSKYDTSFIWKWLIMSFLA